VKRSKEGPLRRSDKEQVDILRQSTSESDRKFWSGERPISLVQGIGLLFMFLAVIGAVLLGNWPKGEAPWWEKIVNGYGAAMAIFLCFALFLVLGNRRFRRKGRPSQED
jgi:hypothetical protein